MTLTTLETGDTPARFWGPVYAWSGFLIMWGFWTCFVVFLANPRWAAAHWPLPTVNRGGLSLHPAFAAVIDLTLISLFGFQHSVMARPWFKNRIMGGVPPAFVRCTFVHAANIALFALILLWQPIPMDVWTAPLPLRSIIWAVFAAGWLILFLGALSFGIFDLLGLEQIWAWNRCLPPPQPRLKTGLLYRWLRHPMYVGVLMAIWATPQMSLGHLMLATGMTIYVLIAMRYEERDLALRFGQAYKRWRVPRLAAS